MTTVLLVLSGTAAFGADPIEAVSTPQPLNLAGSGISAEPVFSRDGRHIAFISEANNLVANDDLVPWVDVFVRDLQAGTTALVSVNQTGTGGLNQHCTQFAISSNGQFVAFSTFADNLAPQAASQAGDIFLRDLGAQTTTLISKAFTGGCARGAKPGSQGAPLSGNPRISEDGRWLVFESLATNLVDLPDANQSMDIFAWDRQWQRMSLISVNLTGTAAASSRSEGPVLSPDGHWVAFVSSATNLVAGGPMSGRPEIYVRDLQAQTTSWASSNVAGFFGGAGDFYCFNLALSANGRCLAFLAARSNSVSALAFHLDLQAGAATLLTRGAPAESWPQIDETGRFVVFDDQNNVFRWDAQNQSNQLVSVGVDGLQPGYGISRWPALSPDGQTIAFMSTSTNLLANFTGGGSNFFQLYTRDMAAGTTRLASIRMDGRASTADLWPSEYAFSPDGRRLAFDCRDDGLVPQDLNKNGDVFVRDLIAETTELVSQRHPEKPARAGAAPSYMRPGALSFDGRWVAFSGNDNSFATNDTNRVRDLFMRDLATGDVLPLSTGTNGAFIPNQVATFPCLSSNGQYALFFTIDPNTSGMPVRHLMWRDQGRGTLEEVDPAFDYNGAQLWDQDHFPLPLLSPDGRWVAYARSVPSGINIFLRDMFARTNLLISASYADPATPATGNSKCPAISPDQRWVVFQSSAWNVWTNTLGSYFLLYARDLDSNTTRLISLFDPNGRPRIITPTSYVFSASGHFLAFSDTSTNSYLYDFQADLLRVVCTNCTRPQPSADGRWIAFKRGGDVFLQDAQTGGAKLLSASFEGSGGGNQFSAAPVISADGRYTVFASLANNLVPNDTNKAADIFVYDRLQSVLLLVSQNSLGTGSGDKGSGYPFMAADGRTLVFQSAAGNLAPADYNHASDIFVLRLGAGDSDNDGLPDDWEAAYFGDLSHDGSLDSDSDGQADLQEFLAGTDPANKGSILQVLTLQSPNGGPVTLLWSSAPGKTYRVEYKDDLQSPWSALPGTVTATSTTTSAQDAASPPETQRFYRVVLAQ